ncbi:MAG TPA: Ig-like domain-containing protein, partial [Microbacterium sp.]|nr:Ig-like domain-containing protein [Microbacterium sp.]
FGSNDIDNGTSWQPLGTKLRANLPQNADGGKPRHGTVIPVTRAEYQKVLEAYAPSIAVASVSAMEATTEPGVAPVLPGAQLTMADGSGKTVDVSWEAIDPQRYAAAGTFTVAGIAQDDSRMPVEATVTVENAIEAVVSAETRCVAGKVTLTARVTNDGVQPIDIVVATAYGSKTATLAAGKSVAYAFSTRLASVPSGDVRVTATADGASRTVTAAYAPRSCG